MSLLLIGGNLIQTDFIRFTRLNDSENPTKACIYMADGGFTEMSLEDFEVLKESVRMSAMADADAITVRENPIVMADAEVIERERERCAKLAEYCDASELLPMKIDKSATDWISGYSAACKLIAEKIRS